MKKEIKKIGIITKRNNERANDIVKKLHAYLKKKKKIVFCDQNSFEICGENESYKKEKMLSKVDLAIVMGGDGTLLKTASRTSTKKTIILGANLGTLGFLTEATPSKLIETLDKVLKGDYYIDKRSLLRVTIYRRGKKIRTFLALNDAVVNQGSFARLIDLDFSVNGRKVVNFKADGMIVATPTGSTAHSLSAGGSIIHPEVECLAITPICPSSLSMRPFIVPGNKQMHVTINTQRREDAEKIGLTIDGQNCIDLQYGDKITFRRSKRYFHLARTQNRYYKMLRTKLNWGEVKKKKCV